MSRESEVAAQWAEDCARAAGPWNASIVTHRLASDPSGLLRGTSVFCSCPSGMVPVLELRGESLVGVLRCWAPMLGSGGRTTRLRRVPASARCSNRYARAAVIEIRWRLLTCAAGPPPPYAWRSD